MVRRLMYEGRAQDLEQKLRDLGRTRVQIVAIEEDAASSKHDQSFWDENERQLEALMNGAPVLRSQSFTAEDFYPQDDFGTNA